MLVGGWISALLYEECPNGGPINADDVVPVTECLRLKTERLLRDYIGGGGSSGDHSVCPSRLESQFQGRRRDSDWDPEEKSVC